MEREIKFRGKCVKTGKWLYGGITAKSHTIDDKTFIVSNQFFEGDEENEHLAFFEVDPKTVGQFVGLKHKLYNNIFEGDILQSKRGKLFVIQWEGAGFKLNQKNGKKVYSSSGVDSLLLVGNVHDNQELLNN